MTPHLKSMIRNAIYTSAAVLSIPILIYIIGISTPQLTQQDSFQATVIEVNRSSQCESIECVQAQLRSPSGEYFNLSNLPNNIQIQQQVPVIADYYDNDHVEYRFDKQHWLMVKK